MPLGRVTDQHIRGLSGREKQKSRRGRHFFRKKFRNPGYQVNSKRDGEASKKIPIRDGIRMRKNKITFLLRMEKALNTK